MADPAPKATEFERFDSLMRGIVRTPTKAIERQKAMYEKHKAVSRRKREKVG